MKKQYITPQSKIVNLSSSGHFLESSFNEDKAFDELGARRGDVWEEDEEEPIEDSMWK